MKKNKRKIKVPAAAYGLGQATTAEMAGLSGLYNSNSIASGQLPTPSMPNVAVQPKAPAMGGGFGGAMQMLPDAIDLVSNPFKKSTATSGKDAAMQSVANVGKGAAMGAMVGGPVGAIVGAGIGAIGSGGEKASMSSFTDYDEGTLGTGIIGAVGNKKLRAERRRIKTNAYNNKAAVQGTADLENRYGLDYGDLDTSTFAVGGEIPSSLAYVDDGELIQTPDGSVSKVPEMGQPLDSNLVNLPEGSRILSNTLKVPGTKKTFSQLGDEMMTKKISKGKDKFAENSNKLNAMNNKAIHDQLFEIQEQVKLTRGIKNKNKSVESFAKGGSTSKRFRRVPITYEVRNDIFGQVAPDGSLIPMDDVSNQNLPKYRYIQDDKGNYGINENNEYFDLSQSRNVQSANKSKKQSKVRDINAKGYTEYPTQFNPLPITRQLANNTTFNVVPEGSYTGNPIANYSNISAASPAITPTRTTASSSRRVTPTKQSDLSLSAVEDPVLDDSYDLPLTAQDIKPGFVPIKRTGEVPEPEYKDYTSPISDALTGIAAITPALSNMLAGSAEQVNAVYNPYASAINRTMRGRRFDINPAIEDLNRNRAVSNYNTSQINTNTGANLAYRLQSATNMDRAISNLRAQESNVNNQYAGEYANTMNSLGQQWVGATNMANEANAQNRATTRNIRRTGMSQLSQFAQTRQQMRNQKNRDDAMMALYAPFLQAGFSSGTMQQFGKYLNKGGNRYVG